MAQDVAPELYSKIARQFNNAFYNDPTIRSLYRKVADGKADYAEAARFAEQAGKICSETLRSCLTADALPDGKLYYNIAQRTVTPALTQMHELVDDVCQQVQTSMNESAGIGIAAQSVPVDEDRIHGITSTAANAETLEQAHAVLDEPVVNYSQHIVDKAVQRNADFQYKAGVEPKIVRKVVGDCCAWCAALAGTYDYADVSDTGNDVFRRHQFCRCTVTFVSGRQRQNVWSKKTWEESPDTLEQRKTVGLAQGRGQDVTPEYFGTATPGKGKITIPDGYNETTHANEVKTAHWLHDTFGGDITLLNESGIEGQKTADYLWNGKLWDLKNTSTEKAADAAVRKGLRQIQDNPGGIILDYGDHDISMSVLEKVIDTRMTRGFESTTDIVVLSQNKVEKVLRYKK